MLLALSTLGRGIGTAVAVGAWLFVALVGARLVGRAVDDRYSRVHARNIVTSTAGIVAAIAIAVLWNAFGGHLGVVVGLFAAGLAFAAQELVGALAGWFNIVSGHIFRVGDRIQIGDVQGDVIDVTLLRTKVLEIGSTQPGGASWVHGRQPSGRIVTLSNKSTFTNPVYNYSGTFDFVWEELCFPVPYGSDWRAAESILLEEAEEASDSKGARAAIETMASRYPMPRTEVEPRVFVNATSNYIELATRFVIPTRQARSIKDQMTRRVLERFDEAGIRVASETIDVTVYPPPSEA